MPSREPELYKDKVEVSLDGRQIFYLFFGGSVIVGIVFVLGVLVGRRVEARGHVDRARTHTAQDPLAALDRLEGAGGLSFQGALTGKDAPSTVEKTIDQIEKQKQAEPPAKQAEPKKAEPAVKKLDDPAKAVSPPAKQAEPKQDAPKPEPKQDAPKAEPKKADEPKKAEPKKAEPDGPVVKPEKAEAAADKKPDPDKKPEDKTRYTLQLSSFQDRTEAEAFLQQVKAQGFTAQITQADVEGKGTFYRVRTGTYRSLEAANSAKSELEKSGKQASVMKL